MQDSIIVNSNLLLQNEIELNKHLTKNIEDNTIQYEKYLRQEKMKKMF